MHKFKFRILFFSLVFFPITILLGIWQINRADEKNNIMDQYAELIKKPPIQLANSYQYSNWEPVYGEGVYLDEIIYEDNAISNGKAGYKVYHLFELVTGENIFVNRGFIERKPMKNDLPEVSVPEGLFFIQGNVLLKQKNAFAKEINESDSRIIQEFNLANIKRKRGLENKEIYDFLFNLAPSDPFKLVPIEKPISMSASKHIGYAIQWFGLSVVLVVMTLIAFLKKNE